MLDKYKRKRDKAFLFCYNHITLEADMNIIFLDVDGVLTSINYAKKIYEQTGISRSSYAYPIDPECLDNICELVMKTDAKIVVTSTWRHAKRDVIN